MVRQLSQTLFYGNFFVGFLAVALTAEACVQMSLPNPGWLYNLLIFCGVCFYYNLAYASAVSSTLANQRVIWFTKNRRFVAWCQRLFLGVLVLSSLGLLSRQYEGMVQIPLHLWIMLGCWMLVALLYYRQETKSWHFRGLRQTGWLKPFVIGFVWAGTIHWLPLAYLHLVYGPVQTKGILSIWLLIKTWMFCTVNAILFDIKDYSADSNRQLKTFVVQLGPHKTLAFIIFPLLASGLFSFLIFSRYMHFGPERMVWNLIPFGLMGWAAWWLFKPRSLLFYLVVVDGILMVKAVCGILGAYSAH